MKIIAWLNQNYRVYISFALMILFISMRVFSPELESIWLPFCTSILCCEASWYDARKKVAKLETKAALWYRISAILGAFTLIEGLVLWAIVTPQTEELVFTIISSLCVISLIVTFIPQYIISKNV